MVYLYDYIVFDDWWGGVLVIMFVKELVGIIVDVIYLCVNFFGGDVFVVCVMEMVFCGYFVKVIVYVDGLVVSVVSFLIMVVDEIEILDGVFLMIYKVWMVLWGNVDDLCFEVDLFDKIDVMFVRIYEQCSGQFVDDIFVWMIVEMWFGVDEVVEKGFVDCKVDVLVQLLVKVFVWNLQVYLNVLKFVSNEFVVFVNVFV